MSVRPESLESPERGLALENREMKRRVASIPGPQREPGPPSAEEELAALRERIARAHKIVPGQDGLHCRDCFQRGRDAALKEIEGE